MSGTQGHRLLNNDFEASLNYKRSPSQKNKQNLKANKLTKNSYYEYLGIVMQACMQRMENDDFETSLGYIVSPGLKNNFNCMQMIPMVISNMIESNNEDNGKHL